jgi:hypothetical protein
VEYVGMSAEAEKPEPHSGDRGVFGNLPSERPGVRSPRRGGDKSARPQASKPGPPQRERPAAPEPPPAAARPEPESQRPGIEDVAWAGVTVAAEAATLGVRLFSRALEAVRERR